MSIPEAYALSLEYHRAGRLAEAEALYRQILAAQPGHADAWHHLGILALQARQPELAIELIRKAISLKSNHAGAHSNLGEAYRAAGRPEEAIPAYRASLELAASADTQNNLGIALKETGRMDEAMAAYRSALRLNPGHPKAYFNLGVTLAELGRNEEAADAHREALRADPAFAEAWNSLGNALRALGQFEEALMAYRRAVECKAAYPEAWNNLGISLVEKGGIEEAIDAYRRVIELQPGRAEAYNNLGNALREKGRWEDAGAAFHRALELKPDYPDAYYNLGIVLADQGRLDEAVGVYRDALAISPEHAGVYNNLGGLLKDQGLAEDASDAYRRAAQLKPEYPWLQSNLIYTLQFLPGANEATMGTEYRIWNEQFGHAWRDRVVKHDNVRDPARRLKIGYVSPDLLDQVVGRNLAPLLRLHDHEQFEIICYSGAKRPDSLTAEFQKKADQWRDTVGISDDTVAGMIREDQIDILVDLTQHMAENRLPVFTRRPAPVQMSFAGYPDGTGLDAIPYRIGDRYMESQIADLRSAKQVFLLDSFWCYNPLGIDLRVNESPAQRNGHVTFGCLNNFCKVNAPVLKLWARVLREVDESRLLLLCPPGSARERTADALASGGVDKRRIEFIGTDTRRKYMEQFHRVDIALDPFPYNGHTTSLDALWMGVPVVSLAGARSVARAGWSQLSNLGGAEWVAFSGEDYVRIAADLAGDRERLVGLRASLRSRMEGSLLMDGARFARGIEAVYRTAWRRWCGEGLQ